MTSRIGVLGALSTNKVESPAMQGSKNIEISERARQVVRERAADAAEIIGEWSRIASACWD